MPIIPPVPPTIRDCAVYSRLKSAEAPEDGLSARVESLVATAAPLLNLVVAGPFRNYTLHNPDHSKKLVHLAGAITSPATLLALSPLECTLFIYAAYIHDLGMALTSVERDRLLKDPLFLDFMQSSGTIWSRMRETRSRLQGVKSNAPEAERLGMELEVFQLQEVALSDFLRPQHAKRSTYERLVNTLVASSGRADLFQYKGVSFSDVLIAICESHNLDVGALSEVRGPYDFRFPRDAVFAGQVVNVQFISALLRLTDILDFDRERTPTVLFDNLSISINSMPGSEVSLMEWQKHMAVHTIELNDHEIVVTADSKHPAIESAIRTFATMIERELRDTLSVLRNNTAAITEKYSLCAPATVRSRIRSVGYVYHDIRLRLNESSVISLLMGDRLYGNSAASVRELIQNAVDACSVRNRLDSTSTYEAQVTVQLSQDAEARQWIEVCDNGIGMDEHVISEYLFHIGSSYYESSAFERLMKGGGGKEFVPVSRFGIGILSVFMIGDLLEVITCNTSSVRGDIKQRTVRVAGAGGLAFITEEATGTQGTRVKLRLRPEFADDYSLAKMCSYIRDVVVRPLCPVDVSVGRHVFSVKPDSFSEIAPRFGDVAKKWQVELVFVQLDKFSDKLKGVIAIAFRSDGKQLDLADGDIVFDRLQGIDPADVFLGFKGNRLTVNGFKMGLRRATRIFGKKLRIAFDIDVKGDREVVFDVSRDRIVGNGLVVVRRRIRDAIMLALRETGVLERMTEAAKRYVESNRLIWGDEGGAVDDDTLALVASRIPNGQWPVGLHHDIARDLSIPAGRARAAISMLLEAGAIPDGRRGQ